MTYFNIDNKSVQVKGILNAGDKLLVSQVEIYLQELVKAVESEINGTKTKTLLNMAGMVLNLTEEQNYQNIDSLYCGMMCHDDGCFLNLGNADRLLCA